MDVVADLPADAQSPEPVQQGEALLDDPAVHAQPGPVLGASSRDERRDAVLPHQRAVLVVVVAPVGVEGVRASARTAPLAADRRDRLDQGDQLGDVVAVATGQRDRQRNAVPFGDQMVFRASSGTVDRARSGFGPPLSARTWEPSTTAFDQSSASTAFNSASSDSCSRCQTPASFQSRSRRQHVIPDPKPNSCGRNSHEMPVYSTNRIPHSALRSSRRLRPG